MSEAATVPESEAVGSHWAHCVPCDVRCGKSSTDLTLLLRLIHRGVAREEANCIRVRDGPIR